MPRRPSVEMLAAITTLAALAAFAMLATAPGRPLGDAAAGTARLLVGTDSGEAAATVGSGPATVLPLLFWGTVLAGLWRLVRNPVRLWRIRHRGGHLVIAGDDSLAPIVAGEGRSGNPAIVLAPAESSGWLRQVHRLGSPHLPHDRLDALADHARTARLVLIAGPDDEENIETARSIVTASDRLAERAVALPVIVRVDDVRRHDAAERALRHDEADHRVQLRLISLPALLARALLRHDLIDRVERLGSAERLLVVVGLTPVTEHYLIDLMVSAHPADGRAVRIAVIDRAADTHRATLAARWPHLDQLGRPQFIAADVTDPRALAAAMDDVVATIGAPATVLIDLADDTRSAVALQAVDASLGRADRVPPAYAVHASATALAHSPVAALAFGGTDVAAYAELLLYEQQETIARAIHDVYLEGRLDAGEALDSQPRTRRWESLTERRRDDVRLLVDVYLLTLRDIGARIVPGRGAPLAFTADEARAMVRAQHERWLASRTLEGWRWGETRDEDGRRHPEMVPADDLPAEAIEREREHLRIVTRLLARSGRRAVRDLRVLVVDGHAGDVAAAAAALADAYPDRALVFLGDPGDAGVRTTLGQLRLLGHPVQLCVDHRGGATLPTAAAALRDLIAQADRVIVCAPDQSPDAVLATLAHHRLAPVPRARGTRAHADRVPA